MGLVERAGFGTQPALILGETGTGKELIARMIHEQGRSGEPFVAVNCAALPASLWEDEIFGHVRGAFTDARHDRRGRVEEAGRGSLFFDEIGEMPLDMQAKLLRLLQESEYSPVGGSQTRPARCRFLFATNRSIEEMIAQGRFRSDLYYRINVFQFQLPPLRERSEDIPALVDVFLRTYGPEFRNRVTEVDAQALGALCSYPFPGNIRELQNLILRAVAVAEGPSLTLADLNLPSVAAGSKTLGPAAGPWTGTVGFQELMAARAREIITHALQVSKGNRSRAAELLGLHRSSLEYRIRELGLDVRSFEK